MEKTERDDLEALARDAAAEPWCLHPNGTSVWTGDEYDTEGNKPQRMILTGTPSPWDATLLAFVAAANPAVVLKLLQKIDQLQSDAEVLARAIDELPEGSLLGGYAQTYSLGVVINRVLVR